MSVQWAWPSALPCEPRHQALKSFCRRLARAWVAFERAGHPLEVGYEFQEHVLPKLLDEFNRPSAGQPGAMPRLAALVCNSAFDLALHDAFGKLVGRPMYQTYGAEYLGADLARLSEPGRGHPGQLSRAVSRGLSPGSTSPPTSRLAPGGRAGPDGRRRTDGREPEDG